MKIEINKVDEMPIEEFANTNNLTMVVNERPVHPKSDVRYYAMFKRTEVLGLTEAYGNGRTPGEAIKDYAYRISFKKIVINPRTLRRQEIEAPRLTYEAKDES